MIDVFGTALLDYQNARYSEDIITSSSLKQDDTMPLPYLFRNYHEMPMLEQIALQHCRGKILDVGAGAGSHSLYLQQKGFNVTALDYSPGAVETCRLRGVGMVELSNILNFKDQKFDTLLLLMNGIGIAGQLTKLSAYLHCLKALMNPGGQILLDSSDIIYMFDYDRDGSFYMPAQANYYGEVQFTMHYKKLTSKPFFWLYLDQTNLKNAAASCGLSCEIVSTGDHYDYLARLKQS